MILTQDLCQLQEDSRVTALTRQQVTFRIDIAIARVIAAAAPRRYALKREPVFIPHTPLSHSPSCTRSRTPSQM